MQRDKQNQQDSTGRMRAQSNFRFLQIAFLLTLFNSCFSFWRYSNRTEPDVTTPKGQSVSLPADGDIPKEEVTDSQERLVAIKAEETNACNENLKTAVNMT